MSFCGPNGNSFFLKKNNKKVEFYGGAGVQHIALNTSNIIAAISALQARGCDFLRPPKA